MCLRLRERRSNSPYNKSNIRWKCVAIINGCPVSAYRGKKYKKKNWNYAELGTYGHIPYYSESSHGFHVLLNKKDAETLSGELGAEPRKIEVVGFLKSGMFGSMKSETWMAFRFID